MKRYNITLNGTSPLLMHSDNLAFAEKLKQWRDDPANKELSISGDDRTPAWTWISCIYSDGRTLGIPSDNLMTVLREGGAKVMTGKGKATYKKATQAGLLIDGMQFDLLVDDKPIKVDWISKLIGDNSFPDHLDAVESHGFELLVKRARIGMSKHIRVRPMFRNWVAAGSLTVLDEELTGLTQRVLQQILDQAGALCGLGDWRPSSPRASGTFGRFQPVVTQI